MCHDLAQYYNDETELSLLRIIGEFYWKEQKREKIDMSECNAYNAKLPTQYFFIKKCINSRAYIN